MKQFFQKFTNLFRFHKMKFFVIVASGIIFFVVRFPYNDLGTLVQTQVAAQTQNNVQLKFKSLSLSLMPIGLQVENVEVQTTALPAIRANEIALSPSILSFLAFHPGFQVKASGLMKGTVDLTIQSLKDAGEGNAPPTPIQRIDLSAQSIDMKSLLSVVSSMTGLDGKLNFTANGDVAPGMEKQPKLALTVGLANLRTTSFSVDTPMGALPLPDILLTQSNVKANMKDGKLEVVEAQLGDEKDEVSVKMKGQMNLSMQNLNGQFVSVPSNYDFRFKILAKKGFQEKGSLFLGFLESVKSSRSTPQLAEYTFRVNGPDFRTPATPTVISDF